MPTLATTAESSAVTLHLDPSVERFLPPCPRSISGDPELPGPAPHPAEIWNPKW